MGFDIVDVDEKLNSELLSNFRGEKDGYVQVGDRKWFLPVRYRKIAEGFKNFEVRSDDIWITGYPRSGTTLTDDLTWLLSHNLDFEGSKEFRVMLFESDLVWNEKTEQEILKKFPNEEDQLKRKRESLKILKEEKRRRVIKTHLPFELLPPDVFKKGCKIIYVCRYPKDVCVSYFFLQSSLRHIDFCGDFEKFWQYFRNGNTMFGPYFEHVSQGFNKIGSKNFLFVFFEEFRKDMTAYIKKISEFLEVGLSEDQLKQLEDHMSLENYKKLHTAIKNKDNKPVEFCRKGKVGGWRDHFTDEMNKEADSWIEVNSERIGIKYPQQVDGKYS